VSAFVGLRFRTRAPVIERSAHERPEQRMRFQGFRFELGMELAPQEPGMIGELANLDVDAVGSLTRQAQAVFF
jgi:hypothetical protein